MHLIKKTFAILFLLGLQAFFVANSWAADDNPYNIEDVAVNVSAKSPSEARNLGVKTARRDAFLILLTRLSLNPKLSDRIDDEEISQMVRSERISDEKIAGNNYFANFHIIFAKDFVDHILSQNYVKESEKTESKSQKTAFLVVSGKMLKKKLLLWEQSNDWRSALNKALQDSGDKNFRTPSVDIDDMAILNDDNLTQIIYEDVEPLFSKYRVETIYVAIYSYDEVANRVNVSVRGIGKFRKTQTKIAFVNSAKLDETDLMAKIAVKTAEYLIGINNPKDSNRQVSENLIQMEVPVSKLGEWLMIKAQLEKSGLINKLNIASVSRDYINILVNYTDIRDIVEAFDSKGFSLTQKTDDSYILILK